MSHLLRTLGAVGLIECSASGDRPVAMPAKRFSLLIYLALGARGSSLRRDALLALLWPEADQEHGRAALRQALTGLRRQLGADAIVTRGEAEVGLAPGAVTCDVSEFEQACAAGQHSAARAAYQGDFLPGFHVTGLAPEFEHWADGERARLRRMAVTSAREAARHAEAGGNLAEAVEYARRAVELAPEDEAAVATLIGVLDRAGDRAGALAAYTDLERRLAAEYSAEPSPETRALIEAARVRLRPHRPAPGPDAEAGLSEAGDQSRSPATPVEAAPSRRVRHGWKLWLAGGIGAALMLASVAVPAWVRRPALPDGAVVAVMPFRVTATDSSLAFLHEGMVHLLSIRLTGEGGMRVVEPGRLLAEWERQAPRSADRSEGAAWRIAAAVGAGRIIQGGVTGTADLVALSAWVVAPGGKVLARASAEGSPDSLPVLVDQLAAQLLGLDAGLEGSRVASFRGTPLPAIRAFLAGRRAFRTGRKEVARQRFAEALALDSNFTLAALDLLRTTAWVPDSTHAETARRRVMAGRDRLSAADRALLGGETTLTNGPQTLEHLRTLTSTYPDRPEPWYDLGDAYFHFGRLADIDNSLELAEVAFRRGRQVDSPDQQGAPMSPMPPLVAEPMEHMVQLAHMRGDSLEVRRLVGLIVAADSSSALARGMRWHLAAMEGPQARKAYWERLGDAPSLSIMYIHGFIVATGLGAEDYPQASAETLRRLPRDNPRVAPYISRVIALNNGRPSEAARAIAGPGTSSSRRFQLQIYEALSWGGDSALASEAARQLARYSERPADDPDEIRIRAQEACALGQWQLAQGDLQAGEAASRRLRAARLPQLRGDDSVSFHQTADLCAALLDAWRVSLQGPAPAARAAVAVADSLARTNIFQICCPEGVGNANLRLAWLWQRSGDPTQALRAVRRRGGPFGIGPLYHSSFLREEGRLAALLGDTAGAIRAYRHYLALRYDPEPSLRPEVERVRNELTALLARRGP